MMTNSTADLFTNDTSENWAGFTPTRDAAEARLKSFVSSAGSAYARTRNFDHGPDDRSNVSVLSPYIRHRAVTEEEVLRETLSAHSFSKAEKFIQEVYWRTYFKGWLEHRPSAWRSYCQTISSLSSDLEKNAGRARAYAQATTGTTGIEGFDSWAQELVETGYLHNHARMWFASIWIFTLKLPWEWGADFFLRHLLDGDPASNTLSWRWVAGLHTKGKTYLARASNIEQYTNGRFCPEGKLATYAEALDETTPHPKQPLSNGDDVPADVPYLLLITEEDLSPAGLEIASAPKMVLGLPPALSYQDQNFAPALAEPVLRFKSALHQDAMERAAKNLGCQSEMLSIGSIEETANAIAGFAKMVDVKTIATAFAPQGPTRDLLDALEGKLASNGHQLKRIQRAYDAAAWPHASKGFFALKSKIPMLLAEAGITG
ncbi:MAG: FAD-binding domain-containing protein [Pseudomonadota bacterium]